MLKNTWIFDHIQSSTGEDKNRTSVYQKRFNEHHLLNTIPENSMLFDNRNNNTVVDIIEIDSRSIDNIDSTIMRRASDLTSRTNQFNMAKKIYSESQIRSFIEKEEFTILMVDVRDDDGNEYGLTGLVIFNMLDKNLIIDTFLLSCRVIGQCL